MHKFSYENTYPEQLPVKVEFTVPSDADLTDMLEQFELYLKAVGFSFDGNIDIVPEHGFEDTVRDAEAWFDDTVKDYENSVRFDEYGNYGENNPPVGEKNYSQDMTGTGHFLPYGYPAYNYNDVKLKYE